MGCPQDHHEAPRCLPIRSPCENVDRVARAITRDFCEILSFVWDFTRLWERHYQYVWRGEWMLRNVWSRECIGKRLRLSRNFWQLELVNNDSLRSFRMAKVHSPFAVMKRPKKSDWKCDATKRSQCRASPLLKPSNQGLHWSLVEAIILTQYFPCF